MKYDMATSMGVGKHAGRTIGMTSSYLTSESSYWYYPYNITLFTYIRKICNYFETVENISLGLINIIECFLVVRFL